MSEPRECPFCGNPVEHESTITEEVIRCTMCPAKMVYDGSYAALFAMWNARPTPPDSMERVKEVVCQAHMAGQLNAGCAEPSWSEAHTHYTYKAQPALSDSPPKGCEWTYDDTQGSWHTGCGQDWCLTDGATPAEHGMRYCYHCGQTISTPAEQDTP